MSDAGLFLAGGNHFGGPWEGRYPFTQPDSTVNMWMLADSFPANLKMLTLTSMVQIGVAKKILLGNYGIWTV